MTRCVRRRLLIDWANADAKPNFRSGLEIEPGIEDSGAVGERADRDQIDAGRGDLRRRDVGRCAREASQKLLKDWRGWHPVHLAVFSMREPSVSRTDHPALNATTAPARLKWLISPVGISEAEAKPNRGINRATIEVAVLQATIHL